MKKAYCVIVFLVLLTASSSAGLAQAQPNGPSLTNKDVIELVKTGLSSEVIVAKIKNSRSNFDTSPAVLGQLKDSGVPEAVILAMVQAPASVMNDAPTISPNKPPERSGGKNLYEVRKIFIDEMGKSDDAERFRLLLGEKLSEKGFTIVEKPDDADAILKGALATQLAQGTTRARVSVYLKSITGQSLWNEDYGVRFVFGPHRDSIKLRAEDVANGLQDAWKKSAKAAGITTK